MDISRLRDKIKKILGDLTKEKDALGQSSPSEFNLNFYKIHALSNKENIHSKFIAFLLNPKGSHGCKQSFLDIFVGILRKKGGNIEPDFKYNNVIAETGSIIDRKENKGGRVDILIENRNPKRHIIIENKIYALDQDKQLEHYRNEYKEEATLVYLTLDGRKASSRNLGNITEEDYIKLSYKDDIINWLQLCKDYLFDSKIETETANKVSFLLTEYLALVQELTKEQAKRDELLPILTQDKETLDNVFKIHDNVQKKLVDDPVDEVISSLIRPLKAYIIKTKFCGESKEDDSFLNKLCNKNGWKWELNGVKWVTQKGWGFYIYKEEWDHQKNRVEFKFAKEQLENCVYFLLKDGVQLEPKNLPQEYFNWHRKVFYELMDVNMEKTGLFLELEKSISEMINRKENKLLI